MREIKFRAWDKVTKRYYAVSGLEFDENGELCEVYLAGIEIDESNHTVNVRKPSDVVLEQDTGLKDKNSKEVYEGDILKFEDSIFEIGWLNKGARFGFCPVKNCNFGMGFSLSRSEVIGNIHENGELIEKEQ